MGENGPPAPAPEWMQRVAEAGGWQAHAEQLMDTMSKIPPEKFKNLNDMIGTIQRIFDAHGSTNVQLLKGVTDSIVDQFNTQVNSIVADAKNTITGAINEALEPIMPYIADIANQVANGIALGLEGWTSVFTGKWDDFERRIEALFPGITEWRDEIFRPLFTNFIEKARYEMGKYLYEIWTKAFRTMMNTWLTILKTMMGTYGPLAQFFANMNMPNMDAPPDEASDMVGPHGHGYER